MKAGTEAAMSFDKGHREFQTLDMDAGWETPEGYPPGFKQKIVWGVLDERNKRGNRTRFLRVDPGTFSIVQVVHDYWEEVLLVSGDLVVGNDASGNGGEQFRPFTHAVRPPGVHHGPFKSETGCLLYETHWYA
jgi:hypothetical protein